MSEPTHNHDHKHDNDHKRFQVEERRRQVSCLIAQSKTETEIANRLGVDQSTISRDVTALKELSKQFVYDLARSDLAYYHKQCINGINEVQRKAWELFDKDNPELTPRDKLLALKVIKEGFIEKFDLFDKGPNMMAIMSMDERVRQIENRQNNE